MTMNMTDDDARETCAGAIIIDQQPRHIRPEDAASNGRIGDDACLPLKCPECGEAWVDVTTVVYQGKWQCRFCGTQIRLAIGRDRGIVDPAHGDLYIRIVRPGEAQPRPVPSSCLCTFRGEVRAQWRDPWEYDEIRGSKKRPEGSPDVTGIEFDAVLASPTAIILAITIAVLIGAGVGVALAFVLLSG